jgi:hypothetical protein
MADRWVNGRFSRMIGSSREMERVRRHTAPDANRKIDETIRQAVRACALQPGKIERRLDELGREFDIERTLQANASVVALSGIALAATVNRRWMILPAAVLSFLLLHATRGWCPPLPFFRRLGVRTRSEIERERFALKFLRGDFAGIDAVEARRSPDAMLAAAVK